MKYIIGIIQPDRLDDVRFRTSLEEVANREWQKSIEAIRSREISLKK